MTQTANRLTESAAHHLKYDVMMLRRTQELLAVPPGPNEHAALRYALLESFTIHTRVLCEFFYERARADKVDDVRADLYCAGWTAGRPQKLADLDVVKRMGFEIAHASFKRLEVTSELKPWQHKLIRDELEKTLASFLKQVDPRELLDEDTRSVLALENKKITYSVGSQVEGDMTSGLVGLTPGGLEWIGPDLSGTSSGGLREPIIPSPS
jgi:hypothetical protein